MKFTEAPLRRVRLLRGYGALTVAAALMVSVLTLPYGESQLLTGGVISGAIALGGVIQIWLGYRTSPAAVIGRSFDPSQLAVPDQRRYFSYQLVVTAAAFTGMSFWVVYQINSLEAGTAAYRIRLWRPIAFLYERFGYWPAVTAAPAIGLVLCVFWVFKLTNADD